MTKVYVIWILNHRNGGKTLMRQAWFDETLAKHYVDLYNVDAHIDDEYYLQELNVVLE